MALVSPCQVMMATTPLAMNMNVPIKFQIGCNEITIYAMSDDVDLDFRTHFEDALLNEVFAIDNVSDDEDKANDEVGHQAGVAKVLCVNVGVRVAELEGGGGEVEVTAVVSVSARDHFTFSEERGMVGWCWPCCAICIIPLKANIIRLRSASSLATDGHANC